jgi:large subunit ribosomal protein L31
MKQGIHPEYQLATVRCSCGEEFQTRSTVAELVDAGGRVERFERRYGKRNSPQATS